MNIRLLLVFTLIWLVSYSTIAQVDTCISVVQKHHIASEKLAETREFWVSLPMFYDATQSYPVLYVLDAEWRFDLVRAIAWDLSGNRKMPHHIVVGIPHVEWRNKRGIDLTFSHSRMEYDGEVVNSSFYNASNSGRGEAFFQYFYAELIPAVNKAYPTNGKNVLIGHSYGGYFGSYILAKEHPFSAFQIYDPSIWYSDGEVIRQVEQYLSKTVTANIYISYQPLPEFHSNKIKQFIETLKAYPKLTIGTKEYTAETHNSLFMYSFLDGMAFLYKNWEVKK